MRNPDAAWVSNERLKEITEEELNKFPHLCPDFVVELRSKGDTLKELKAKMKEWMENGCRLGWLIDADEETFMFTLKTRKLFIKDLTHRYPENRCFRNLTWCFLS